MPTLAEELVGYKLYEGLPLDAAVQWAREETHRQLNGSEQTAGILSDLDALEEKVRERIMRSRCLLPGVAPRHPADEVPYTSAVTRLRQSIARVLGPTGGREVVHCTAGIGKTELALQHIAQDTSGQQYDIYVPTHELGDEIVKRLADLGVHDAIALMGRNYVDPGDGKPICKRADMIDALGEKYVKSPGPIICATPFSTCPHADDCSYAGQFRYLEHSKPRVVVRTHEALFQKPGFLETRACAGWRKDPKSIVDEDPTKAGLDFEEGGWLRAGLMLTAEAHGHGPIMDLVLSTVYQGDDVAAVLGPAGAARLRAFLEALESPQNTFYEPGNADEDVAQEIDRVIRKHAPAAALWQLVHAAEHGLPYNAAWRPQRREDGTQPLPGRLLFSAFRPWVRATGDLLVLDATGTRELCDWIPRVDEFVKAKVVRNAIIHQFYDRSFSLTSLTDKTMKKADPERAAAVRFAHDVLARQHGRVGVIAQKVLVQALPELADAAWFGALRGIDHLKDCDAILVVGRPLPQPLTVEGRARAHFPHAELDLTGKYIYRPAGYRTRYPVGTPDLGHADPRVDLVMRAIRDGEVEQAFDRLRLIERDLHSTAFPRAVYLLTPSPLPVRVDVVASSPIHDKRLHAAMSKSGAVLPLVPAWLAEHFPELWKKGKAAERWASRLLPTTPGCYKNSLIGTGGCQPAGEPGHRITVDNKKTNMAWALGAGEPGPECWGELNHHQRGIYDTPPDWYWHQRASRGWMGIRRGRFRLKHLHARKPEGAAFLWAPGTAPEFALAVQFPDDEVLWVDPGLDGDELGALFSAP